MVERKLVSELVPKRNLVIATTPRTLLDEDNIVSLLGSEIFHLSASNKEIIERAEADGLAMHPELTDQDDLDATLDAMRSDSSETFDRFTTIDTTGKNTGDVVDALRQSGADIEDPHASGAQRSTTSSGMDTRTQRIFTMIIACALAVLVVLVVLILAF